MMRFELDDGTLRRFWEVALDGDTLRFRSGDLGSDGKAVVRRYRSERTAQDTLEQAVRQMVSQGYVQVLAVPDLPAAPQQPAWAALERDPDDLAALAVHADWLDAQGDPRGERIHTLLAARARPELAGLADTLPPWPDPPGVDGFPGDVRLEWSLGYVTSARLESQTRGSAELPDRVLRLLAGDDFRLLRSLTLYVPGALTLGSAVRLPSLRELVLHAGVWSSSWTPSARLDLDALAERLPRLEALVVRGASEVCGNAVLAGLTRLEVRASPAWTARIAGAPRLERLALHGAGPADLGRLGQAGVLGRLRSLTLTPGSSTSPARLARVLGPAGVDGLALTLEGVELDEHDVRALRALPLRSITVDGRLTPEADALLKTASFPVDGRLRVVPHSDVDDEPVRPAGLELTRLEAGEGHTGRFWSIGIDGSVHHVCYGAIGTRGRWIWSRFPTDDVAEEVFERRIEEKLREGYRPTEARVLGAPVA